MNILKDKKIIALGVILIIFTISYFVIVNKVSYAFQDKTDNTEIYDNTLEIIKKSAIAYGQSNPDLFKENDTAYIKVQDLIDNSYLVPNDEGNIPNPLKSSENLNANIIKIKNINDEISVDIDI